VNTIYILFMVFSINGGGAVMTQEFDSQKACELARSRIETTHEEKKQSSTFSFGLGLQASFCTPKG
jgi:hypothetical protein